MKIEIDRDDQLMLLVLLSREQKEWQNELDDKRELWEKYPGYRDTIGYYTERINRIKNFRDRIK
jgi:hypothetical protein